jgi:hypothetical protein
MSKIIIILFVSLVVVSWNLVFAKFGSIIGQLDANTDEYHHIKFIDSKTNLCPPGYIVDESGYCNADTISVVPDITSSEVDKNITTKETEPEEDQTGENATTIHTSSLISYENSTFGVKMDYPSNWELGSDSSTYPTTTISVFYSPEIDDYASVSLVVENLSNSFTGSPTLDEYLLHSIDGYRLYPDLFPDFTLNYSSVITQTLSGRPAYSLVGSFIDPELGHQKLIELGIIKNGLAYYIQYFASPSKYTEYFPMLENMIDSFELIQ